MTLQENAKNKSFDNFLKTINRDALDVFKQNMINKKQDISLSGSILPKKLWQRDIFYPAMFKIWKEANAKIS